jgi:ferredoxin
MIMITLTLASMHSIIGRLNAIEQPSTIQGINEEECNKIFNCKIIAENVFKYPDDVNPFNKNEEFAETVMNNSNDTEKFERQSCQKLMDVDIENTKDQQTDKQTPKFLICLP